MLKTNVLSFFDYLLIVSFKNIYFKHNNPDNNYGIIHMYFNKHLFEFFKFFEISMPNMLLNYVYKCRVCIQFYFFVQY